MKFKIFISVALLFFIAVPDIRAGEQWHEMRSSHFIVYYHNAPEDFIKTVSRTAEDYYDEITRNLGFFRTESWSWDHRGKIYIYDNRDDYIKESKSAAWSHGIAAVKDKIIRTFPSAYGFFDSILPHELGHIIFREFVGFKSDIPIWMDEGVAMYQEKAKRWGANGIVKKAIEDGTFLTISDLTKTYRLDDTMSSDFINLFYAESASIVYYLITELGRYRFVSFCKELKRGASFKRAIKKTYRRFDDINDLNKSWVNYLKDQ